MAEEDAIIETGKGQFADELYALGNYSPDCNEIIDLILWCEAYRMPPTLSSYRIYERRKREQSVVSLEKSGTTGQGESTQ